MLLYDESLLNLQITQYLKKHPHTDVYIVSHSLGGVIAFGYLASLIENTHKTALENGSILKGLAILDSPFGGVTGGSNYEKGIVLKTLLPFIGCNPQEVDYTTIGGLQTLYNTASSPVVRRETGSVFSAFIGGKYISNQDVATHAANMGVRILVVGNTNDVLWQPDLCLIGANFLSTEYLKELGRQSNDGALYSRSVASGFRGCRSLVTNRGNHFDVLYRTDVEQAIWETFTGNPMDQLNAITDMPVVPTPTPTTIPVPVPTPTQPPTPTPTNTPTPTATPSPTPTPTATPIPTPTPSPTPPPTNMIAEFPLPSIASIPEGITTGPDGNLWFAERQGKIGRITPNGTITEFSPPTANSGPSGITSGPDGNLWFTEAYTDQIGRITPNGTITEFPLPTRNSNWLFGITAGPDGNLWFTEFAGNKIGQITPNGTITEFPLPTATSGPFAITTGPDGNLWFVEAYASQIGRITPDGTITEFPTLTPKSSPWGITSGPDGNLWFTENSGIGRITPNGTIAEFPLPTASSSPWGITAGPDGNLWFTERQGNKIGRIAPH